MIDIKLQLNTEQLAEYKQTAITHILKNKELVEMLAPDVEIDELPYRNIFPYGKIVGTTDEARAYINIEVDMTTTSASLRGDNSYFKEYMITFTIVVHDTLMKTDMGVNRMDALSIALEKMFSEQKLLGVKELELVSNQEGVWTERHSYRQLRFRILDVKRRC